MDAAGLLASTAAMRWMGVTKRHNADRAIGAGGIFMTQNNTASQNKPSNHKLMDSNYLEKYGSTQIIESLSIHPHPPLSFSALRKSTTNDLPSWIELASIWPCGHEHPKSRAFGLQKIIYGRLNSHLTIHSMVLSDSIHLEKTTTL
jgi:hypothetical protein